MCWNNNYPHIITNNSQLLTSWDVWKFLIKTEKDTPELLYSYNYKIISIFKLILVMEKKIIFESHSAPVKGEWCQGFARHLWNIY